MSRRTGFSSSLFYALLAAVAVVPQGCSRVQQAVSGNASQDAVQLYGEAETFRLMASTDLLHALAIYGTPQANLRFAALGRETFPNGDWQGNWRLMLATSLPNVGQAADGTPLAGFYHPWSDTMLLTRWSKGEDGKPKIAALDVLPGAHVRGKPDSYGLGRAWQRGQTFAPEAVARLTAETVLAFERNPDPLAGMDVETKRLLPRMVGVPFEDYRRETGPLFLPGTDGGAVIRLWKEAYETAGTGKVGGSGPLAQGTAVLAKLDAETRGSLIPVAWLTTDKAALLMLASQVQPNLFFVLQTGGPGGRDDPRRLDLVNFQTFYGAAAKGGDK